MHEMESINRRTWRSLLSLRDYGRASGYLEEGERMLLRMVECHHPRARVLDIGCGGGRTAALVSHIADDYLGVDYTPEMVAVARSKHPALRFEQMDARDLSPLADASFDVVLFSYNGLDSVDPTGRLAALREVCRVLKPGGDFAFSTFHKHWAGFERSSRPYGLAWTMHPLRMSLRSVRWAIGKVRERRYMSLERRDEHTILLHSAHDFGVMVYATPPAQILRQLADAGFGGAPTIIDQRGHPVKETAGPESEYFHVLASKPRHATSANVLRSGDEPAAAPG